MKYDLMLEARRLRKEDGLAMGEIALRLKVSKGTVSRWVHDIELTGDQCEVLLQKNPAYNRQMAGTKKFSQIQRKERASFQEKGRQRAREKSWLHSVGCMLYWAEGSKSRNALSFVNSDVSMMKLFMEFLRKEMKVADEQISFSVNVYPGTHTVEAVEKYWLSQLKLPVKALRKSTVSRIPCSSSGKKKNKLPYGVARIGVCNTEVLQHIYGAIQEYSGEDNEKWIG